MRPGAASVCAVLTVCGGASVRAHNHGGPWVGRSRADAYRDGVIFPRGRRGRTPSPSSSQAPHHSLPRRLESSFVPLLVLSPPKSLRWISAGAPCGPSLPLRGTSPAASCTSPFRGRSVAFGSLRAALRAASLRRSRVRTDRTLCASVCAVCQQGGGLAKAQQSVPVWVHQGKRCADPAVSTPPPRRFAARSPSPCRGGSGAVRPQTPPAAASGACGSGRVRSLTARSIDLQTSP